MFLLAMPWGHSFKRTSESHSIWLHKGPGEFELLPREPAERVAEFEA